MKSTEETYQKYHAKRETVLTILKIMWRECPSINVQRLGDHLYGLITGQ